MATRLQDEVVVPAEPELYRWPPWQAYRDAAQPATTGAPDVEFVSRAGASRRPLLAHQRIHVLWVSGLYPRALRRRALDVTVAHDGEAAPKRRGVTLPTAAATVRARRDASGESASGAVDAADVDVAAAPPGAMVFAGARYNVVALRSTAVTAILLKRSVPLAHRRAAKNVRRAGNVASLLLAATAPLRASVRLLVKPHTVAAAVLPMATLRELAQGDGDAPQLHTLQLPLFTLPRSMHLATTARLTGYLESREEDAPGAGTAADASRSARIGAFMRRCCGGAQRDEAPAAKRPVIGIVCVRASLQYLRGTTDDGAYDGPERIVVKSVPKGPKAVNRLVANHWVRLLALMLIVRARLLSVPARRCARTTTSSACSRLRSARRCRPRSWRCARRASIRTTVMASSAVAPPTPPCTCSASGATRRPRRTSSATAAASSRTSAATSKFLCQRTCRASQATMRCAPSLRAVRLPCWLLCSWARLTRAVAA
jgi:hypothetical protein